MEVVDNVMAGPDAAGLDPERFSARPGEASCGRADPDDVRAFERALSDGDKEAPQQAAPAPQEERHGLQGGADFSRAEPTPPDGRAAPGAGAPEDKPVRDPAPGFDREAPQKSPRSSEPKLDQKPALKSGMPEDKPRAQLSEEPGRSAAKDLNQEAFLAAMFGRGADAVNAAPQPLVVAPAAEAGEPRGAALADGDLSRLVERILVGSPEKGGSEVRLVMNDSLLPGTEIRVARDAAGALQVMIETRDDAAFQTLVGARNDLERALQASEKSPVSLDMRRDGGSEGDMRRRSRGLDEQDNLR